MGVSYGDALPPLSNPTRRVQYPHVLVLEALRDGNEFQSPKTRDLFLLQLLRAAQMVERRYGGGWQLTARGKAALLLPSTPRGEKDLGTPLEQSYLRNVYRLPGGPHSNPRNAYKRTEYRKWVERRLSQSPAGASGDSTQEVWGVFPTALGIVVGVAFAGIDHYDPMLPILAHGAQLFGTLEEHRRLCELKERRLAERRRIDKDVYEWHLTLQGRQLLESCRVQVPRAVAASPCPFPHLGEYVDREEETALLLLQIASAGEEAA